MRTSDLISGFSHHQLSFSHRKLRSSVETLRAFRLLGGWRGEEKSTRREASGTMSKITRAFTTSTMRSLFVSVMSHFHILTLVEKCYFYGLHKRALLGEGNYAHFRICTQDKVRILDSLNAALLHAF
jgi:hypothetical protein